MVRKGREEEIFTLSLRRRGKRENFATCLLLDILSRNQGEREKGPVTI